MQSKQNVSAKYIFIIQPKKYTTVTKKYICKFFFAVSITENKITVD